MEIPTLVLRKSLMEKLSGLTLIYGSPPTTVAIHAFEEYFQKSPTRDKAMLNIGNVMVEAYIILLNQTMNDNSSKCMRNDLTSIQVQCVTVWPANKGGSMISELIAQSVLSELLDSNGLFSELVLPDPCNAWKGELVSIAPITFNEQNSRTWITQLVIEYAITQ